MGTSCSRNRPSSPFAFPPQYRLKQRKDFLRLEQEGKKLYSNAFLLVIAPSLGECSRLGVTVTRKLDKRAAVRNRIKRRVREVFRRHRARIAGNYDLLVIARRGAAECKYIDVKRQIMGALHHHGYLAK